MRRVKDAGAAQGGREGFLAFFARTGRIAHWFARMRTELCLGGELGD